MLSHICLTISLCTLSIGLSHDLQSARNFANHAPLPILQRGLGDGHQAPKMSRDRWKSREERIQLSSVHAMSSIEPRTARLQVDAIRQPDVWWYITPVEIGGHTLHMLISALSSDLWVLSPALPSNMTVRHRVYDSSISNNSKLLPCQSWIQPWGESYVSGIVGSDIVSIGGASVTSQAIQMATAIAQDITAVDDFDGVIGLGFGTQNSVEPTKQTTLFDNLMPQLRAPLLSVDLGRDNGTYLFGDNDASRYVGNLSRIPIQGNASYWRVASGTIRIGNTTVSPNSSSAILDPTASLILIEPQFVAMYYSQIPGAENNANSSKCGFFCGWTIPCNSTGPVFEISLGLGYMAKIPAADLIFARLNNITCFGSIQSNRGAESRVLGAMFFLSQYVVFDRRDTGYVHIATKQNT